MKFEVYHYHILVSSDQSEVLARLALIQSALTGLSTQGNEIMATTKQLVEAGAAAAAAVAAIGVEVAKIGPAVNVLEAKVTAALANAGIPPEVQAEIDAAFASFGAITTAAGEVAAQAAAAVADAADGVDEGATPPA